MGIATQPETFRFVSASWVSKGNTARLTSMIVYYLLEAVLVKMVVFVLMELEDMIVIAQGQVFAFLKSSLC